MGKPGDPINPAAKALLEKLAAKKEPQVSPKIEDLDQAIFSDPRNPPEFEPDPGPDVQGQVVISTNEIISIVPLESTQRERDLCDRIAEHQAKLEQAVDLHWRASARVTELEAEVSRLNARIAELEDELRRAPGSSQFKADQRAVRPDPRPVRPETVTPRFKQGKAGKADRD